MPPKQLLLPGLLVALLAPAAFAQSAFGPPATYSTGAGSQPMGLALADLNGDGRPEAITTNRGTNTVSVLPGLAGAAFGPAATYPVGQAPTGLAVGDVNGDGRPDLVTGNQDDGTLSVLLNLAAAPGTFGSAASLRSGGVRAYFLTLTDLNSDGRPDIAVATNDLGNASGSSGGAVAVLLASGNTPGAFAPAVAYPVPGASPIGLAVGDVNGDNRPDLVTGDYDANTVSVLLASASAPGTFGAARSYGSGPYFTVGVALADFNGDGRPDIAAANLGNNSLGVLLNSATAPGTFNAVVTYTVGALPNLIAVADFNGDGRPDLVTGNQNGNSLGVLTGRASPAGTFAPVATYATGASTSPIGVAVADLNGDGHPDLVAALQNANAVGVLLNTYQYLAAAPAATPADFTLYPNPAHDRCTLSVPANLAGPAQAELLDVLGTVVRRQAAVLPATASQLAFDAGSLAPGAYTLRLRAGSQVLVRRVLLR